jgi:hypothetical protein
VILALTLVLTILFSSPDDRRARSSSGRAPTRSTSSPPPPRSSTARALWPGYGPPYNHNGNGQNIWFIHLQKWLGVSHPIDTAKDFVLAPLASITGQPALTSAISTYQGASAKDQTAWTDAYTKALSNAKANSDGSISLAAGNYGSVPTLMNSLLSFAQGGGLDGALLTSKQFYQTDYTKPLLLMADGGLLASRAKDEHLLGTQWGMMNETGSYPGQSWLWLYTFWYQIKPFSTSTNADILVMALMGVLSLAFVLVPLIPGVRDLPRRIPIYKLIWREHYRSLARGG